MVEWIEITLSIVGATAGLIKIFYSRAKQYLALSRIKIMLDDGRLCASRTELANANMLEVEIDRWCGLMKRNTHLQFISCCNKCDEWPHFH